MTPTSVSLEESQWAVHETKTKIAVPDWFVQPRQGAGSDGRGGYGAVRNGDD